MTSLGLLLCSLITVTSAGQQFLASPTILEIGLVKKLQIECTATADSTIVLTTQIRILFSNNTVRPVYDLLGLVDSVFGLYNSSGAADSGEIIGNGTSKLRLTWKYPKHDRAGVYKCEIRSRTIDDVQKKSLTVKVTAVVPDQVTFFNACQQISSDLDLVKSKFFRVSNVFQGQRYYLSPDINILVMGDAEAMCEIFGGYLVEIDSAEEYQFILRFLNSFPKTQLVLTGATDEVLENNWINIQSQTQVKYINWGSGEPNMGREENCLYFFSGDGLKMVDYRCSTGLDNYILAYLCEIDE